MSDAPDLAAYDRRREQHLNKLGFDDSDKENTA